MSIARQIFTIVPAEGKATLGTEQRGLLMGKAQWLYAAHIAGLPVMPTIAMTRAAWEALKEHPRDEKNRLHRIWIAALFRLVERGKTPPHLVVRTSAARHSAGLMPARTGLSAPASEAEAIDIHRPLARAIEQAFHSYATAGPLWENGDTELARSRQIVIIQPMGEGPLVQFDTRHAQTGVLGPTPEETVQLAGAAPLARRMAALLDAQSGRHMHCALHLRADGTPQLLSARPYQATAAAELAAAVDRVEQGVWSPHQAVLSFEPERLPQLLHPRLGAGIEHATIARGLGVSPGAASGHIAFNTEDAARLKARGKHCILVAMETGPADVDGMKAASGILTARGGQNSHAAIVARISGKPCVGALRALEIDSQNLVCRIGDTECRSGDVITIDGTDGAVYAGRLPLSQPHIGGGIAKLLDWSDASRTIAVRTNVETLEAARTALAFGAEGIGLARSEHMFFAHERMLGLRRMILCENEAERREAVEGLIAFQKGDYADLLRVMKGQPVTVRLFDPPLHEFLPRSDEDIAETAKALGLDEPRLRNRLERLAEINPMLGHRGCRLAVTYPEILDMQIRALIEGVRVAAVGAAGMVRVEVMVPFVSSSREVSWVRERVFAIAEREGLRDMGNVEFGFGTMIELPRAALRAAEIAPLVDFFSFGTNDLTQSTFGISRDDAPVFLAKYLRDGLYDADPFATIDQQGVGELIAIAIERGRAANPNLKIGICGEHAGDPASVRFFAGLGIDYVSCSPYRVPLARLALGQSQRTND